MVARDEDLVARQKDHELDDGHGCRTLWKGAVRARAYAAPAGDAPDVGVGLSHGGVEGVLLIHGSLRWPYRLAEPRWRVWTRVQKPPLNADSRHADTRGSRKN